MYSQIEFISGTMPLDGRHNSSLYCPIQKTTKTLPPFMVLQRSPENDRQDDSHPLVLAVNDYADNLEFLTCLLESVGCDSIAAYHGRDAIEMARQHHPDLILLDIMMPELDGMEVLKQLRNNPQTRDIPVIAVTGMDRNREYFLSAGFDDWLRKPIEFEELEEVIRRHL